MSNTYVYGREEVGFVTEEAELGTHVLPVAGNGFKFRSLEMNPSRERVDRNEKGSTRSTINRISRRLAVDWSLEKYLLPSGTAGTAPDDGAIFKALFGEETVDAGTSVTYGLTAEPSITLDIVRDLPPFREVLTGAKPSSMELTFGGGDEPRVSFSGAAQDHLLSGRDTVDGAVTTSTSVVVTDASLFSVGMFVKIGTDDNGGAGYEITAIDYDTETLTIGTAGSFGDGDAIIPVPVTPTTTGDVIPVTVGSVTFGGRTLYVTGGTVSVNQNAEARNDEYGVEKLTGYRYPSFREVSLSLEMYYLAEHVDIVNDLRRFGAVDMAIVIGETAGSILTINANQVEYEVISGTVPEDGEGTLSLSGKALGSSGEDEIELVFT